MTPPATKQLNGFAKPFWISITVIGVLIASIGGVLWGETQKNAAAISRVEKEAIAKISKVETEAERERDTIDTNIANQLHDFRVMLMRIEVRQQADSQAIRRIERKIGD